MNEITVESMIAKLEKLILAAEKGFLTHIASLSVPEAKVVLKALKEKENADRTD